MAGFLLSTIRSVVPAATVVAADISVAVSAADASSAIDGAVSAALIWEYFLILLELNCPNSLSSLRSILFTVLLIVFLLEPHLYVLPLEFAGLCSLLICSGLICSGWSLPVWSSLFVLWCLLASGGSGCDEQF